MYDIKQDERRKVLIATVSGSIDFAKANVMLNDFKKASTNLNPKEYVLIIKQENLSSNIFVIPVLQSFVKLVSELDFKKVCLVNLDRYSAFIKLELGNSDMARSLSFFSNIEDALNNL